MKIKSMKLLLPLALILSLNSLSQEKYVCSGDLSPFGGTGFETKTYERTGDYFTKINSMGDKSYFYILEDNDTFLTLINSTSNYPSVFVTFIDKKNKTFVENYFSDMTSSTPSIPLKGSCIRVD